MSSLEKCQVNVFCPFLIGLFICCCCWIVWAVCIFLNLSPCWSHNLQIFLHSPYIGCLFILFMVSFAPQNLVSLIRYHLFIFVFTSLALGDWLKKILVWFMSSSEKAMAPHSSTLAWKIPWTEEPGRLQSMGSRRVRHNWATSLSLFTFMHWRRKWQPTPVFLPGDSQGWRSPVGFCPWGHTESDTTEAT